MVNDEDAPTPRSDSSPGDDELPSVDARRDAGDWLEPRDDLPRASPNSSSSRLWPPRIPMQSLRRLHRVQGVSDLMSTDRDRIIASTAPRLPAIELDGLRISIEAPEDTTGHMQGRTYESQDPPPSRSVDMDEDETALAVAIELSLRSQNRYTPMGTDLEELRQALENSVI